MIHEFGTARTAAVIGFILVLAVLPLSGAPVQPQDPAVDKPPAAATGPSLDDLPEDFPIPEGTLVESGETRGNHRTLKLSVEGKSFDELFRHFAQQLPEKNFRILNQTQDLPLAGFERASSFTVRARNGAVFGLMIVEAEGRLFYVLEGRF